MVKWWDLDTQHCFKTMIGHRTEVYVGSWAQGENAKAKMAFFSGLFRALFSLLIVITMCCFEKQYDLFGESSTGCQSI